tara:strand:+ start:322 stop:747 length:426 start_codon:yes stop_codon:yes gene_type:complete
MNLIKWTPNSTGMNLFNDFDSIFNSILNVDQYKPNHWSPSFNVSENDSQFVVYADLPGVEKKNLIVEVENDVVSISGERMSKSDSEDTYYTNCTSGKFCRTFSLPENCNGEGVSGKLKNGVLELSIPKVEKVRNIKKINIK